MGAGVIGRAIGKVLEENGAKVGFYDKDKNKIPPAADAFEKIAASADFVFLCVPARALPEAVAKIIPIARQETIFVSLSKGLVFRPAAERPGAERPAADIACALSARDGSPGDGSTSVFAISARDLLQHRATSASGRRIDQFLAQELADRPWAILGGPMLGGELERGMKAVGVVAANSDAAAQRIEELFFGSRIFIERSRNVAGVALAGALKNIYVLGVGIADGIGWGDNLKGWLLAGSSREIRGVMKALSVSEEEACKTACLADLIATGSSPYSRNLLAGRRLAENTEEIPQSEGIMALPMIWRALGEKAKQFPILRALTKIVTDKKPAREALENLFRV